MISTQARDGFDHLLKQAIQSTMAASSDEDFEIRVLNDLSEIRQSNLLVLTVSSYVFRLIVLLHFTPDDHTKTHFARINHVEASEMSELSLYDAIAECGNMCCGVLNRELSKFFPHLGMSTPNFIDKNCSSFLDTLNPGHVQHFKVNINNNTLFHVGLCVSDYSDLDFVVNADDVVTHTGEMELFF